MNPIDPNTIKKLIEAFEFIREFCRSHSRCCDCPLESHCRPILSKTNENIIETLKGHWRLKDD